jgi:hypothetical protein
VVVSGLNAAVAADGHGLGQWLSAAVVAIPAAGVAAKRLLDELRSRRQLVVIGT